MRRSLAWALGRRIGDDHGEVLARSDHFGLQADGGKPPNLVVNGARLVVHAADWCHGVGWIVGYHDIAEHEPAARPEPLGDASEEVRLTRTVKMVHGQSRYNKVEVALRQGF